jgi:hypothetical protein
VTTNAPTLSKADEDNLDLLGVLYWVYGGTIALAGLSIGAFSLIGIALMATPATKGGPPPALLGGALAFVFAFAAVLVLAKAVVMFFVGAAMRKRTSYTLCLVGAAMAVMNIPLGTALAIFTFVTLNKPETKQRFGA